VNTAIYDWNSFRPYVNAVYLRGALFLKTVRSAVGDEAFFAFLKEYFNRYSYKMATAQDFFSLLSEFTSADLNALKTDFFR
jgi:aminopeptidase N